MYGHTFIVKFDGAFGYITPEKSLTLQQLNIADMASMMKPGSYWTFKVTKYISNDRRLIGEVIAGGFGDPSFPREQLDYRRTLEELSQIYFTKIDTSAVLPTISSFTNRVTSASVQQSGIPFKTYDEPAIEKTSNVPELPKAQERKTIKINVKQPIKKLDFEKGNVSFNYSIPETSLNPKIIVYNDYLKREFDAVKDYFENLFNSKTVNVNITIELLDGKLSSVQAESQEISSINQESLERIRFEYVKDLVTKTRVKADKVLFTMDELITELSDGKITSDILYTDSNELLVDLGKITNTKHYQHLRYLSKRHDKSLMRLRFTLKPFSYILIIDGNSNYHIIWETLDTEEATYIWRIEKDRRVLEQFVQELEQVIKHVRINGKREYLNNNDHHLTRIYHHYNLEDAGFELWKDQLNNTVI